MIKKTNNLTVSDIRKTRENLYFVTKNFNSDNLIKFIKKNAIEFKNN
jgi:hypothetical protein